MTEADPRPRALVGLVVVGLVVLALGGVWWAIGQRPATLIVDPSPPTATVRVGEVEGVGRTEVQVAPGPASVRVQAPGHLPYAITVHVAAGSEVVLTPRLVELR